MAILGLRSLFWNCCASVGGPSLCCTGADDTTVQPGTQGALQPPILLSGSTEITRERRRKDKHKKHKVPVSPDDNITTVESTRDTSEATQCSRHGGLRSGVALDLVGPTMSRELPVDSSQRRKAENHPEAPSVVLMNDRGGGPRVAQRQSSLEKDSIQPDAERRSMSVAEEALLRSRTSTPQTPQIVRRGTVSSINGSLPSRRSSRLPPKRWPKDTLSVKPSNQPSSPMSSLVEGSEGFTAVATIEDGSTFDEVSPGVRAQSSLLQQNPTVRSVEENDARETSTALCIESDISEKESLAPFSSLITLPEPWKNGTNKSIPRYHEWGTVAKRCLASNLRTILEYFGKHTSFSDMANGNAIGLPVCLEIPELGDQKRYGDVLINYQTAEWHVRLKDATEPIGNLKNVFPLQRTVAEPVTMANLSNLLDITVDDTDRFRIVFQEPYASLNCCGFLFLLRLLRDNEASNSNTKEKTSPLSASDVPPFGADLKANTGRENAFVALPGLCTPALPTRLLMGPVVSTEEEAERDKKRREDAKARIYKQTPFSMLIKSTVPQQKSKAPTAQTSDISA